MHHYNKSSNTAKNDSWNIAFMTHKTLHQTNTSWNISSIIHASRMWNACRKYYKTSSSAPLHPSFKSKCILHHSAYTTDHMQLCTWQAKHFILHHQYPSYDITQLQCSKQKLLTYPITLYVLHIIQNILRSILKRPHKKPLRLWAQTKSSLWFPVSF